MSRVWPATRPNIRASLFASAVMLFAANIVILRPPSIRIEHMGQSYLNHDVTPRSGNQRKRRKRQRQRQ